MNNLDQIIAGIQHFQQRNLPEAKEIAESILESDSSHNVARLLLGNCEAATGNHNEAIEHYRKCLDLDPNYKEAMLPLAKVLRVVGEKKEAIEIYKKFLDLDPQNAEILLQVAELLLEIAALEKAKQTLKIALKINPNLPKAHLLLGRVARDQNSGVEEAIGHCLKSIEIEPRYTQAYNEMGNYLIRAGDPKSACQSFQKVLEISGPETTPVYSNWLLAQQYRDDISREDIYQNHLGWQQRHACLVKRVNRLDFDNTPAPKRKLRIGFTSGDLYSHSVFFFLNGLFHSYDRDQLSITCFSDLPESGEDSQSKTLKDNVDEWVRIHGFDESKVFEVVRDKKIDILIDISGHTGKSRLLLYLKRAAPVQVTWLGYPDTTGIDSVDYRIIDDVTDPSPWADKLASEKLYRMPGSFLCYKPLDDWYDIEPQPETRDDKIVFGTFNEAPKFSPSVVKLWCQILKAIPEAELVIKCRPFGEEKTREFMMSNLRSCGIDENRVRLLGFIPSNTGHMSTYDVMDVALDPFPYNGTTTSCEALWMGVPFITREGDRHCARVGMSLLQSVGLDDWITYSDEEYVAKAVEIAQDKEGLKALKKSLRDRMIQSPLCDHVGFAKKFGTAMKEMWKEWCDLKNS